MIKRRASLREGNPLLALGKKYSVVTIFLNVVYFKIQLAHTVDRNLGGTVSRKRANNVNELTIT